jgi:hypothetical protein
VLRQQEQAPEKPYKRKKTPRVPSGNKGKERADEAFDVEKAWVVQHVSGLAGIPRRRSLAAILVGEEANAGEGSGGVEDGIECGCCFDSYPFVSRSYLLEHLHPNVDITCLCSVRNGSMR